MRGLAEKANSLISCLEGVSVEKTTVGKKAMACILAALILVALTPFSLLVPARQAYAASTGTWKLVGAEILLGGKYITITSFSDTSGSTKEITQWRDKTVNYSFSVPSSIPVGNESNARISGTTSIDMPTPEEDERLAGAEVSEQTYFFVYYGYYDGEKDKYANNSNEFGV